MTTGETPVGNQLEGERAEARILVVDDELLFARAVTRSLVRHGYVCEHAGTLSDARRLRQQFEPELVLLDMRLPDGSGLDYLHELASDNGTSVIVMTAYGEVEDAVSAMKFGAADYLKKPVDLDELLLNVQKVLARSTINRQLEYSQARESVIQDTGSLVGNSPLMVSVRNQIEKIATTAGASVMPPTVLITGETGTGKDVTAHEIHRRSVRRDRPFVHVDCAALPKELFEAELFGHVKGAFTHAVAGRTGLIEAAEDGVVFLDEIGEIPLDLQAKLLAVLERRSLRRVGSPQEKKTDAWFMAATNRDVEEMVAQGLLRADLYFRLNVLSVELPALRERGDDIAHLAAYFAQHIGRRYRIMNASITDTAKRLLNAYKWPGNVRELQHVIERALFLATDGVIDDSALNIAVSRERDEPPVQFAELEDLTLEEMEKRMISSALERSDSNVSEAARRLGITRMAMRYRMKKYGLGNADS